MKPFQYTRSSGAAGAIQSVLKEPHAHFLAGGTNLVDLMKMGVVLPERLVDINGLPLKGIEKTSAGLRIGALATNSEVADHPLVLEGYPLLSQALNAGASPQLRNMATVGGNMMQRTRCNYFFDTTLPCNKRAPGSGCGALNGINRMHALFGASDKCIAVNPSDMNVAMVALDAVVHVKGPKEGERKIPFEEFHCLPGDHPEKDNTLERGELITAVDLPAAAQAFNRHVYYLKIRDRTSYAFALVSVAAALDMEGSTIRGARLAMGGVAHKPWRLHTAEAFLGGKTASHEVFAEAAKLAMQGAKAYPYNEFKLQMAPNAIVQALENGNRMKKDQIGDPMSRVDGRLKVTGGAKYSGEYKIPGLTYGVLVSATITSGTVTAMDTKAAERAPGVLAVITPFNAPKVPGYQPGAARPTRGLKLFNDNKVYFNGQPIALVVAETFERATYAATLIRATYEKQPFETNFHKNFDKGVVPNEGKYKDYVRGEADAYKTAPVVVEEDYMLPSEMHNPMELHVTTAFWDGGDKVTLYTKSQGVIGSQRAIANAFGLDPANVQINSRFVGGAFGSSLRTWPHEVAAVQAAKLVKRPVKLTLTREQMFTLVGYRPLTIQKIGLGASTDGKLIGITHESHSQTAVYEEFTENAVNVSRFLYASPNANTRYKVVALNVGVPAPMRGPGEATGSFALESALDELSYKLGIDPIELRLRNYTYTDPERDLPWSSKYLKECYQLGSERIGWDKRPAKPGTQQDGEWLVGYGIGCGAFGAYRSKSSAKIKLLPDGTVNIQSATSDIGPGTATSMTLIAADTLGIGADKITFQLGDSSFPVAPTQGGSQTCSSVGSAVHDVCVALKQKLNTLAGLPAESTAPIDYMGILQRLNLPVLELTQDSQAGDEAKKYSMYSFSAHFAQVYVHPLTGQVRVKKLVAVVDGGKIVNHKTASSQMIGGAVGGIGMVLTEEAVFDDAFGRYVNGNFADYHVPVNADIPDIEAIFIDKPDPVINPVGSKGLGEISLIGVAAAVANAVYNASGKRIRELPITPDKILMA